MNGFRVVVSRSFVLLVLTLVFTSLSSSSSSAGSLSAGDRVRVHYSGGYMEGRVVALNDESLLVQTASAEMPVPTDAVQEISKYDGTQRHWGRGLLIGAGAGLVVGSALAASSDEELMHGFEIPYYTVFGAAGGAIVGAFIKSDHWTNVPVGSLQLGVNPIDHSSTTLSLAWSF